jgi:hypothetical protein
MPSRRAAKKTLLNKKKMKVRLKFIRAQTHWTYED